jgi:hypothetical protein
MDREPLKSVHKRAFRVGKTVAEQLRHNTPTLGHSVLVIRETFFPEARRRDLPILCALAAMAYVGARLAEEGKLPGFNPNVQVMILDTPSASVTEAELEYPPDTTQTEVD